MSVESTLRAILGITERFKQVQDNRFFSYRVCLLIGERGFTTMEQITLQSFGDSHEKINETKCFGVIII